VRFEDAHLVPGAPEEQRKGRASDAPTSDHNASLHRPESSDRRHVHQSSLLIQIITSMDIAAADLNLFVVLHAVFETGSATRAAQRLHVTQSAVSNALAKLRAILGDPLVVRTGRGLTPTPRGQEMRPRVAALVGEATALLEASQSFVPETSTRTFTLAAADNHQAREVPLVAARFFAELPSAHLRIVTADYLTATDGFVSGTVDACFAPTEVVRSQPGLLGLPLFKEHAAFVVRAGHPTVKDVLTPALYRSTRQVSVELILGQTGEGARLHAESLKRQGIATTHALTVPHFMTALLTAATTDCVASVPRRMAEVFCAPLSLRMVRATFDTPVLETALVWHHRTDADAGCAFFRQLIARAVSAPASRPPRTRRRRAPCTWDSRPEGSLA
jgi:DNA-binding transcriptional LysR family regulator